MSVSKRKEFKVRFRRRLGLWGQFLKPVYLAFFFIAASTFAVTNSTPVLTWTPSPTAGLTYPAPLTSTQLNATSSVAGTFIYNPSAGTILNVGSNTLVATFTPSNTTNYASGGKISNTVMVSKATPTIIWTNPASITYGTALSGTQLNATSSVAGTFAYNPTNGNILSVGTNPLTAVFRASNTSNYVSPVTNTVSLVVSKATPTIIWTNPASITYGTALSGTQLNATSSVAGTFTYNPTYQTILNAGTNLLTAVFRASNTTNYVYPVTNTVSIVVNKATPVLTWTPSPAAGLTYPAPLTSTQLNATSSVAGTFIYNPSAGTILNVGTNTLVATFTPSNTTNYASGGKISNTVVVSKKTQNIIFGSLPIKYVGDAAFDLTATAGSGLTVTYISSNLNVATVVGSLVTIVGEGSTAITASQAGNSNWSASTSVTQTLTVQPTLNRGLVAYYDGESLKDKTGNIADLSTKGGAAVPSSLNGVTGRAFTLDGLDDGFILPDAEQLKFSSFSIGAWFYWEGQNGQVHQIIFRGGSDSGNDPFSLVINPWDSRLKLQLDHENGSASILMSVANIQPKYWNHAIATLDSTSGKLSLYVNGILASQANISLPMIKNLSASYDPGWGIGNHSGNNIHNYPYQGKIDEVRFYSRTLTSAEVGNLYAKDGMNLDQDGDGLTDVWERGYGRYQIVSGSFTWEQAKFDAEGKGGHLATITSEAEWNSMVAILGDPLTLNGSRWIGGRDAKQEGIWDWITGEKWSYTHWAVNEPQDFGQEDYLQIYNQDLGWGWNDAANSVRLGYFWETGYPTDPFKADTDGDGYDDKTESLAGTDPNDPSIKTWNFVHSYKNVYSSNALDYVYEQQNIARVSEGAITYWSPVSSGQEARLTQKFVFDQPTVAAFLHVNYIYIASFSGAGSGSLWASKDGSEWTLLVDAPTPSFAAGYNFNDYLPQNLLGSKEIWIQARLQSSGSNIMAQFLRYDTNYRTDNAFDLKVLLGSGIAPSITSTNSFSGTMGVPFSSTMTATGTAPITFSASNLPSGLSIATNGLISGTPTTAGTSTAKLTASNAFGTTDQPATFTIAKGTPIITAAPVASPIVAGQALSGSLLAGGSATVGGTFSFLYPPFVPPAGVSVQPVIFNPTDAANYNTAQTTVSVTVRPVPVKEDVRYGTIAGLAGSLGSADGVGAGAKFMGARGVAADAVGNVYVADTGNHTIRKISTSGQVTTIAGTAGQAGTANGLGAVARFRGPWALAVGADGVVYVADTENHAIRKISTSGEVTSLAGSPGVGGSQDGTGTGARFYRPMGIAVDASGTVYVADTGNHTVRMITAAGVVTRVAGRASFAGYVDGGVSQSMLSSPMGLALAADGTVWVADSNNFVLRKLSVGILSTIAGVAGESDLINGQGSVARLRGPIGLTMDGEGSVYFSELSSQYIRKCTAGGLVSTWAGVPNSPGAVDGAYAQVKFYQPAGLAMDGQGNLYVADSGNSTIRMGRATPSNPILAVLRSRQVTESTFPVPVADLVVASDPAGMSAVVNEGFEVRQTSDPTKFEVWTSGGCNYEGNLFLSVQVTLSKGGSSATTLSAIVVMSDDRNEDADGDSLTQAEEEDIYGTSDLKKDTDGDEVNDPVELAEGTDPKNPASYNQLSQGLVAAYSFQGNLLDSSGNGYHLQPFGFNGLQFATGALTGSQAVKLDSVTGRFEATRLNPIRGNAPSTVVVVVKPDNIWGTMVEFGAQTGKNRSTRELNFNSMGGNHLFFTSSYGDIGSPITARNEWMHLASVYETNLGAVRLYVNGKLLEKYFIDGATPEMTLDTSADTPFTIGVTGKALALQTYGHQSLTGLYDEVRIYDRALTPGEIASLYVEFSGGSLPQDWISYGRSFYTTVPGPTWEDAEAQAVRLGGHLVTLNDNAEDRFVFSQYGEGYWIGMTDREVEGNWRWSSGEPVTYTNWINGEPNNNGGQQNYAWYWWGWGGRWDDHILDGRWPWLSSEVIGGVAEIPRSVRGHEPVLQLIGRLLVEGGPGRPAGTVIVTDPDGSPERVQLTLRGRDASFFRLTGNPARILETATETRYESLQRSFEFEIVGVDSQGNSTLLPVTVSVEDDPANNRSVRLGRSIYTFVPGPTWDEAEDQAQALGGHLVTLNDEVEDRFLYQFFGDGYWIGLTDRNGEGNWQWSSGEPVIYTNWLNSEPNNNGGRQNYAWYWWGQGGKWDDHIQEGHWPWVPTEVLGGIAEIRQDTGLEISVTGRALIEGPMGREILPIQILDLGGDPSQVILTLEGLDASLFRISESYPRKLITASMTNFESLSRAFSVVLHAVNSRGHHYVLPLELSLTDDPADNSVRRGLSTYTFVPGPSWDEAEAQAVAMGGHLVTVNDAAEDAFLNSWAGEGYWIGLTDRNGEGNWQWSSGEPVTYTNWLNSEPNNNGGRQNYAWYWWGMGGKWDDHIQEGRWPWVQVEAIGGIAEIRVDSNGDEDGDELSNGQELTLGTDPYKKDTDADGVNDPVELADGTNPKDASSYKSLNLGLVAYYPLNGNAKDASGNGNNASVVGASLTTDRGGAANAAYSFNGGGNYIQLPGNRFLDNSVKVTISAWYRFQGNQSGQIFASGDGRGGYDPFSMRIGPGGFEDFSVADTSAYRTIKANGSLDYRDGVWRHIVMVLKELDSSTSQLLVYLDGCLVTTTNMSPKLTIRYDTDMVSQIGAIHSIQFWKGQLDEFRFYNRDLSATEVAQLYQQEAGNLDTDSDGLTDASERGFGRYQIVPGNFTWDQAKADAEARGGHLGTITSLSEHEAIAAILGLDKMAQIMLGGFQPTGSQEPRGGWGWVTGEAWAYTRWDASSNQPDNYAGAQNILRLWPAGLWDDIQSNSADNKGYLLEFGYPTDPTKPDTDGDGFNDSIESHYSSDPNDPAVTPNTVRAPGYLVAWGSEQYGKALVPPEFRPHPSFAPVVIEASAGWSHTAVLRQNGTVAVWGHDLNGRTQVPAGISRAVSVVAGGDHTLVLQGDGTVVAWGDNQNGQSVVPEGLRNVVQLAGGYRHSLALRSDGTVVGWGYNGDGAVTIPTNLGKVKSIAAGLYHSQAILEDGTIAVWGSNEYGKATPPAGLTQIVELSAGWSHSIARDAAGNLTAWGANPDGRTTIPAGLGPVRAVSAGGDHNLALRPNGTVAAWGRNSDGQINVPANLVGVIRIASGYWHSTALTTDSTDREIPLITLIGSNPLDIYKGSTFADPGAMVTDNKDAMRSISGSGTVNTAAVGIYTLTYTATDAGGNLGLPVTRTVNVVLDPAADEDGDGLSNGGEISGGTNPYQRDSDNDGVNDPVEIADGTNPNDASSCNNLSKGLVAYYPFSGSPKDFSGNGKHGLNEGAQLTTDRFGEPGKAYFFNGSSKIRVPHHDDFNVYPITISAWFRTTDPNPGHLINKYNNATWSGWGLSVVDNGAGVSGTGFYLASRQDALISGYDAYPIFETQTGVNDGRWHQLVLVVDGESGRVFLDGQHQDTQAWRGTPARSQSSWDLYIGYYLNTIVPNEGTWVTFDGDIDDLRVFKRALTTQEVGQLYQTEAGNLDSDGDGLTDAWERGFGRYQIVPGNFTWDQAKADAEARGGHLATITSEAEWNSIAAILGDPLTLNGSRWIGGSDAKQEGMWEWVTGEKWSYTHWAVNEPQDFGQEDYLQIYNKDLGWGWNDNANSVQLGYLWETGYPTDPTKADTDGDGFEDGQETAAQSDPSDPAATPGYEDKAAPQISALGVLPTTVEVSSGAVTAQFSARFKDAISGVGWWQATFANPVNGQTIWVNSWGSRLTQGSKWDGTHAADLVVPRYAQSGAWYLQRLYLTDEANNSLFLEVADLTARGLSANFTVVNTDVDSTPPQISLLEVSPAAVNVNGQSADLVVRIRVTDAQAGVNHWDLVWEPLSGSGRLSAFGGSWNRLSGNEQDGVYETTVTLPAYAAAGPWNLTTITLTDLAGNTANLGSTEIGLLGLQRPVQVTNPQVDSVGPQLAEVELLPPAVDVSQGAATTKIRLRITDNLSGLQTGNFFLKSPVQNQYAVGSFMSATPLTGTSQDGIYEVEVTIPRYAENGIWRLAYAYVWDATGNGTFLDPTSLEASGYDRPLWVGRATVDLAADTDGDGYSNGLELAEGTDRNDARFGPPLITVAGNFQNWSPVPDAFNTMQVVPGSPNAKQLELFFPAAGIYQFKFTRGDWAKVHWGASSTAGVAQTMGISNIPLEITTPGWWKVSFDTRTLVYEITQVAEPDADGDGLSDDWESGQGRYALVGPSSVPASGGVHWGDPGNFTWLTAKADAEARGGHLATVTTPAEWQTIVNRVGADRLYDRSILIGLSDAEEEGTWRWVTGERVGDARWRGLTGEPNGGTTENYVCLPYERFSFGEWVDINLGEISYYLLEHGYPTDGTRADTDSDGFDDLAETLAGTDPNDARQYPLFQENFASCTSGTSVLISGSPNLWAGNSNFLTVSRVYSAGGVAKLGTSSAVGSITTQPLDLSGAGGAFLVKFKVRGWTTVEGSLNVSIPGQPAQNVTIRQAMADPFEAKVLRFTGGTANTTVTFSTSGARVRTFLDDIVICADTASLPVNPGWDFEFGFQHINEAGAESYLVSTSNVRKYSEWQSPPLTYWGPTANEVDGALTYRFPASQPIRVARLKASIESYNFPWPGYFGSGKGWSSIWGSKNGSDWILLLDNPRPTDNVGRGMAYDQQLPGALLGGTDLWIQVRLRVTEAPNSSYTTAQFGRGSSANSQRIFEVKLDYDGLIPETSQAAINSTRLTQSSSSATGYSSSLDSDGDGQTDATELVAGTDPNSANSRFTLRMSSGGAGPAIQTLATGNGASTSRVMTLTWSSVPGKIYTIERSTDLISWPVLDTVKGEAGASITSYEVMVDGERSFYRVGIPAP